MIRDRIHDWHVQETQKYINKEKQYKTKLKYSTNILDKRFLKSAKSRLYLLFRYECHEDHSLEAFIQSMEHSIENASPQDTEDIAQL